VLLRLRPYPVSAFAALTLLIWGNRIWLAWTVGDATTNSRIISSIPIVAFTIPAVVLLVLMVRHAPPRPSVFTTLARGLVIWTIGYWAVRLPMIAVHDHPVAFIVVHAVLAVVSVAAAFLAWRSLDGRSRLLGPIASSKHEALV